MTDTRNRLDNPSPLAKAMETAFGEPSYMSAEEMEAALIGLERVMRDGAFSDLISKDVQGLLIAGEFLRNDWPASVTMAAASVAAQVVHVCDAMISARLVNSEGGRE